MKRNFPFTVSDEAIAFLVFLLCCVISFFRHPAVTDIAYSIAN